MLIVCLCPQNSNIERVLENIVDRMPDEKRYESLSLEDCFIDWTLPEIIETKLWSVQVVVWHSAKFQKWWLQNEKTISQYIMYGSFYVCYGVTC